MKYFLHVLIILFFNYVHVHSIKFACNKVNNLHKLDKNFLRKLDGKVYWIIKHIGYSDNMKKLTYNRVKYVQGILTETTYLMYDERDQILLKSNTRYEIHDKYLAFQATNIDVGKVKYEQSPSGSGYRLEEPFDLTNELEKISKWEIAYVYHDKILDFYIIQSCDGKLVTVEVGDRIYRNITGGNNRLRENLYKEISKAMLKVRIGNEGPYNEPDVLLDIFPQQL